MCFGLNLPTQQLKSCVDFTVLSFGKEETLFDFCVLCVRPRTVTGQDLGGAPRLFADGSVCTLETLKIVLHNTTLYTYVVKLKGHTLAFCLDSTLVANSRMWERKFTLLLYNNDHNN